MRTLALLVIAFLSYVGPAAAMTIGVVEQSTIDRDQVLVGDLFTVDNPELAARPVGDAPAPGSTNTYDVSALRRVAKAYDIAWIPSRLDTKAVVKRDATEITNKQLLEVVRTGLAEQTKAISANADSIEILLDRRTLNVQLPASVKRPIASLVDVSFNPTDYRFKSTLMVEGDGLSQPLMLPVTGRAMPLLNVPVLLRDVNKGDVITDADIESVPVQASKLGSDMITQTTDVLGKEARRDLQPGQVLRVNDLRAQQLVKRGGTVTMIIERGPLRVSTRGRALSDAGVGETVRVLNIQSNRTIEGIVTTDGSVAIQPNT